MSYKLLENILKSTQIHFSGTGATKMWRNKANIRYKTITTTKGKKQKAK